MLCRHQVPDLFIRQGEKRIQCNIYNCVNISHFSYYKIYSIQVKILHCLFIFTLKKLLGRHLFRRCSGENYKGGDGKSQRDSLYVLGGYFLTIHKMYITRTSDFPKHMAGKEG